VNGEADACAVEVGPEFQVVGTNRLEELCLASPAVADGKLLLRTASRLYCITRQDPPPSVPHSQSPRTPLRGALTRPAA